MKKTIARWNSKCAETGKPIPKGEPMYYDKAAKKCYHMDSERAKFEQGNAAGTIWAAENDDAALVQAQEDAYYDHFCTNNDI